jgi:hypothetical protein
VRLVVALLLLVSVPAFAADPPVPPGWPRQAGGNCSLAYWDTNSTGFAVTWYCPPQATAPANTPWSREGFHGNWSEIPEGVFSAMKIGWQLLWSSTDATRTAMWQQHVKAPAGQDYTSVIAMEKAMAVRLDPLYLPQPAPPQTIAPAAYYLVQQRGRLVPVVVGTVPVPFPCDPKQQANNLMAVPTSAVTWTGTARPLIVLAQCAYASP